jgi:DNA helicase TIP49 (TBP-interacting protein)
LKTVGNDGELETTYNLAHTTVDELQDQNVGIGDTIQMDKASGQIKKTKETSVIEGQVAKIERDPII